MQSDSNHQRSHEKRRDRRSAPGRLVFLFAGVMFTWTSPAVGQFVIDASYDHGSVDQLNTTIVGNTIQLAGRDNFNPGSWKWLNFSVSQVAGTQLTFQIGDNFASGSSRLDDHAMVYSYDQTNWLYCGRYCRRTGLR